MQKDKLQVDESKSYTFTYLKNNNNNGDDNNKKSEHITILINLDNFDFEKHVNASLLTPKIELKFTT